MPSFTTGMRRRDVGRNIMCLTRNGSECNVAPHPPVLLYPAAPQQEQQQLAAVAALTGEEDAQGGTGAAGAAGDLSVVTKKTAAGEEGGATAADSGGKKAEALSGLFVLMEVQLHTSSGLRVKVTDLDIAVLQGIATSLIASLGSTGGQAAGAGGAGGAAGGAKTGQQSSAGKSLTYALDKAQRRMVASLRQAFRLADVNGDGTLDRAEVEGMLGLREGNDQHRRRGRDGVRTCADWFGTLVHRKFALGRAESSCLLRRRMIRTTTKKSLLILPAVNPGPPADSSFFVSSPLPHTAADCSAPEAQPPRAEP